MIEVACPPWRRRRGCADHRGQIPRYRGCRVSLLACASSPGHAFDGPSQFPGPWPLPARALGPWPGGNDGALMPPGRQRWSIGAVAAVGGGRVQVAGRGRAGLMGPWGNTVGGAGRGAGQRPGAGADGPGTSHATASIGGNLTRDRGLRPQAGASVNGGSRVICEAARSGTPGPVPGRRAADPDRVMTLSQPWNPIPRDYAAFARNCEDRKGYLAVSSACSTFQVAGLAAQPGHSGRVSRSRWRCRAIAPGGRGARVRAAAQAGARTAWPEPATAARN